jgi:hypothetical protein
MRRLCKIITLALTVVVAAAGVATAEMKEGKPAIRSMSALAFGPDGTLFVGDSKGGTVWALDVADEGSTRWQERFRLADLESKIAAALGTTADDILIHDLAVHPGSRRVYLAVSRGGEEWTSPWNLPNDLADATLLLRIDGEGAIHEVPLAKVSHARADLPNPVADDKTHQWKEGVSLRVDTITDMAFGDGLVYVAGLSNEEFSSTMWKVPYPFGDGVSATTLEIYHGAHGAFETHAPIRTFVPYQLAGEPHLLAAYLCTPFVTFSAADLEDGKHVKGRTLGEFGSGNYPLDMVVYNKDGKDRLLIANSQLPLMIVKPEDIESFEGELLEEPSTYLAGLPYEYRSGAGVQQLDLLNDSSFVALQRQPGGALDLVTLPVRRF